MRTSNFSSERGAVLIHAGVAMIGLLAFSALSIDYGVLWVARGQAQNAADAAALAAATSMAYGDPGDPGFTARVRGVAVAVAQANAVWGESPAINPATDVTVGPCPPGAPGIPDQCVRVDVYRNQARANPLPAFFAQLVGVPNQGVRATATAQVAAGLSTTCMKPWIIPDKWIERRPVAKTWDINDIFDRYNNRVNALLPNPPPLDEYVPATGSNPGSGFTVPGDIGRRVSLKIENWKDDSISAGNFRAIDLPGACSGGGGSLYQCNIENCSLTPLKVGDMVDTEPGGMVGPTDKGVSNLIAGDTAVWMCSNGTVAPSTVDCAGYPSNANTKRLIPVAAFDVQNWMEQVAADETKKSGKHPLKIQRILGFFIEGVTNKEVRGRFTHLPATGGIGNPNIVDSANFLRTIILVR